LVCIRRPRLSAGIGNASVTIIPASIAWFLISYIQSQIGHRAKGERR